MVFWTSLRGSQNSSVASSQVMNHGFWWSTIPKQNAKIGEWHTTNSPRSKKARMSKSKIKSMLIFFTVMGSSTRNLCRQDKLSIKILSGSPGNTQEKGGTCATRQCTPLDAAPRQRPKSYGRLHQLIFGRKKFLWFLRHLFAGSQSL